VKIEEEEEAVSQCKMPAVPEDRPKDEILDEKSLVIVHYL
jgi:hypothetical protein